MAPGPRVSNALTVTRAYGIPDEEVKPLLKDLLEVYDKNWELIEGENYRALLDAYFELKENKGKEGKTGDRMGNHGSERPPKKLHSVGQDDQLPPIKCSTNNLVAEQHSKSGKCSKAGVLGSIQPSSSNSTTHSRSPLHCALPNDEGKNPSSIGKNADERRLYPKKALHASNPKCGPINDCSWRGKIASTSSLSNKDAKPKAVDMPLAAKPISAVNPAIPSSSENSTGNRYVKSTSAQMVKHKNDGYSACRERKSNENSFDIASSSSGEVRLTLSCDSRLSKFSIPNLDVVLGLLEKKYLKLYGDVGGKPFSVMKLLRDMCERYLKLATISNENVAISSSSVLENVPDVLGSNKESLRVGNSKIDSSRKCLSSPKYGSSSDPAIVQEKYYTLPDITKGSEKVKIPLVDEIGTESLPEFNYIPENIIFQNAHVNISLARVSDEDCCSSCSGNCLSLSLPCECARDTGGEFAYTTEGLLKEEFLDACLSMSRDPQAHHCVYCQDCPLERLKNDDKPERCKGHLIRKFIKECWRKCGCDMQCGNRVVQRGITCKLQVFMTCQGKGWGLRTIEELPKGTFVCEYVGEIVTNMELYERTTRSKGNKRHTYPVMLDADWGSERVLKDEEALCLDATYHGNVARFINHRCFDANLIDIPVEVETPDRHYYHLAFFTKRKVDAFEELTWDYGIDFDDHDHPVKAFRCRCGSDSCRDKQSGKRRTKIITPVTPIGRKRKQEE